jgi:hypothetical protein
MYGVSVVFCARQAQRRQKKTPASNAVFDVVVSIRVLGTWSAFSDLTKDDAAGDHHTIGTVGCPGDVVHFLGIDETGGRIERRTTRPRVTRPTDDLGCVVLLLLRRHRPCRHGSGRCYLVTGHGVYGVGKIINVFETGVVYNNVVYCYGGPVPVGPPTVTMIL